MSGVFFFLGIECKVGQEADTSLQKRDGTDLAKGMCYNNQRRIQMGD